MPNDSDTQKNSEGQRTQDLNSWRERTTRQQDAIVNLATSRELASGSRQAAIALATEVGAAALMTARCSTWFLEENDSELVCHDLFELGPKRHSNGVRLAAGDYPSYFDALRSGRAIDAHDAMVDPRTCEFAAGYLSLLGISSMLDAAIRVGGRIVGVVCFEHIGDARIWQPDEISFAGEVADQVAHIIISEQKRLVDADRELLWTQLTESERLRTIGTLAAGIAHDFNNILTPILAHAELAQLSLGDDEVVQSHLKPIVESAEKARQLVQQLLAAGRPAERSSIESSDLVAVAREVVELARASIPASITVDLQVEDGTIPVALSASRMHQVLLNLLVNGGQAIGEGGGHLQVKVGRAGEWAVAEVEDDGCGMGEDLRQRIFEPFFTTKPAGEGSGLGLAVVFGIVNSCQGRIEVESELGKGSRFRLQLPLRDLENQVRAKPVALGPLCILLIDDEPAVVNVVAAQLRHGGHEVVVATTPREALQRVEVEPERYDVVLTDFTMPEMSGGEMLRALREIAPDMPTILMSGLGLDPEDYRDCVSKVLMKPLRIAEITNALAELHRRPRPT